MDITSGGTLDAAGNRKFDEVLANRVENIEIISEYDDLPLPSNGTHTLEDQTAYRFAGFITSPYGLELGTATPIMGSHGSLDGFIHTGGNTAIVGSNAGYFARELYIHAPGGTIYDLTGDQTTEILVQSINSNDAAGLGGIVNLGTIDGMRVPAFKGCNFGDFASGLTFDGAPEKVLVGDCPFRAIDTADVTILNFPSTFSTEIVQLKGNYVTGVRSDTQVVDVDASSIPSEIFEYVNNTHGTTVERTNILNGGVGVQEVGSKVVASYPLRDSSVAGEMHNTISGEVTLGTADTWEVINISSNVDEKERMEKAADGILRYIGRPSKRLKIAFNVSFYGANGSVYTFGLRKNGNTIPTSHTSSVEARGTQANVAVPVSASAEVVTGDEISIEVKNEDGTSNPNIRSYTFMI